MSYMTKLQTIRNRKSVRTFSGEALKPEDKKRILDYASGIINPYALPIEYKILGAAENNLKSPVIVGEQEYIIGKLPRVPHAEEAFGYSFEKLMLYAKSIGVGSVWIAGTMNRRVFEKAVDLKDNEIMPCVSPLGYPAKRRSTREVMMRKAFRADTRLPFEELFFDKSFDTPLTSEAAGKLKSALEAVRLSPSAVNKQPWRAVVSDNVVHFFQRKGNMSTKEMDVQKVDMGIALAHFEIALDVAERHYSFFINKPQINTPDNTVYIASYQL